MKKAKKVLFYAQAGLAIYSIIGAVRKVIHHNRQKSQEKKATQTPPNPA